MKGAIGLLLVLGVGIPGWAQRPLPLDRAGDVRQTHSEVDDLSSADEERDAREIADRINEAVNLRHRVIIVLRNGTSVIVNGRVTAQRYWLIITASDQSEIRFRAAMIATIKIE